MAEKIQSHANGKELILLGEVVQLTGWQVHYIDKLVEAKVLTVFRAPGQRTWRFFYRSEIEAILKPKPK